MTIPQIDALKRLHRVGDPASKTTEKMREAVQSMALYILSIVPPSESPTVLPGGYEIRTVWDETEQAQERYICLPSSTEPQALVVGYGSDLDVLYHFAVDVHGGLIQRIEERHAPQSRTDQEIGEKN